MVEVIIVIFFLLWINFLPPLANLIWKESFNIPLDFNKLWLDGQPLFGSHKTVRGILTSVLGSLLFLPLFDLKWLLVCIAAFLAMTGDLLSSFIKRRLKYESGKPVIVLDQFFEGFFPTIFLANYLNLSWWQVLTIIILFIPITAWGSVFWHYGLSRSSIEKYPQTIRSTVRHKEWRACHQPLARWHVWFNFPNFIYYRMVITWFFKAAGLYHQGMLNALEIYLKQETFSFPSLPRSFNGYRILLLTDLHMDGLKGLTDVLINKIKDLEVDLCLIGGDIRMEIYGPVNRSIVRLRRLCSHIKSKHGIFGVLGNHDCIEMVPDLEKAGMMMLVNDFQEIRQNEEKIWLVGIDDPHYYKVHDLKMAFRGTPNDGFKIFLAHSPEAYNEATQYNTQLYLCGHTHGGQICLPGKGPLFTNSRAPRFTATGKWEYKGMKGYTSNGVGASGVPVRYNCPGEITLITLKSSSNEDQS